MQELQNIDELFLQSEQLNLYTELIKQLNKDFKFANIDFEVNEEILPSSLKLMLHETVYNLIQNKFADYLNLLYIIDVPEKKIKALDGSDALQLSEQVVFLILSREWQKVWYKRKYS